MRAVLPFGGSKNSICHEIEFIFSDIDIIEAYRKTDTGIEFHDRITESVRAFIGEQAENTEGYDFAVQVFVTMTRDRGAVIDTVREGGIVVIIRNNIHCNVIFLQRLRLLSVQQYIVPHIELSASLTDTFIIQKYF